MSELSDEHKEIIYCLERISGKKMTIDNFFEFIKEILPNGYSRDFNEAELNCGYDKEISTLLSE